MLYYYATQWNMPNPPTAIVDLRGFDSSIILIERGGILMYIGDFPESLSQAILVGILLVGRLGVFKGNIVEYAIEAGQLVGFPSGIIR